MEFGRMVYRHSVLCGWSALVAWLVTELLRSNGLESGVFNVGIIMALVGGAIGCGLGISSNLNRGVTSALTRGGRGFLTGAIGGFVGGILGELFFATIGLPRIFGWVLMGGFVGLADGLAAKSNVRIRNGVIGGLIGGFVGGILFDPIANVINSPSGLSSRAVSFVALGLCIGFSVGLVEIFLKEAWLTVVDGYRVGRKHILQADRTVIGRSEYSALPLYGPSNRDIEPEHAYISRGVGGKFDLIDNGSTLGTFINNLKLTSPTTLKNDDVIKIGSNYIRFQSGSNTLPGESHGIQGNSLQNTQPQITNVPTPPPKKGGNRATPSNVNPVSVNRGQIKQESNIVRSDASSNSVRKPPPPPKKSK